MLHIENLWIHRGANYRIELPALHLAKGQIQAIIGASGCGKSTLLEMLGLILRPEGWGQFDLLINRQRLNIAALLASQQATALTAVRARHIGFVLQNGGLLPFLNVRQNIQLPRRLLGLPTKCAWVNDIIAYLELTPLLERLPAHLSMGQRQRVAFVRAIAHQPALLLADEPTAALDPPQARRLLALIIDIVKQYNIAALFVSHDWSLIHAYGIPALQGRPLPGGKGTVFIPHVAAA